MKQFPFRSGQRVVGVERLFPVCPVANEGLYIKEYNGVVPLVFAYCNSPMIAFELLAKHEDSPKTRTTSLPAL